MNYGRLLNFLSDGNFEYIENYPYSKISTIKIGGEIPVLIYPHTSEQLISLINECDACDIPFKIIGNASNLIPPDFPKRVVISTKRLDSFSMDGDFITVGAGVMLPKLIRKMADESLSGLELLYGIPATVGGAVKMNAGAFGASVGDCFYSARCYDIKAKRIITLFSDGMRFSYRSSSVDENIAVLSVTFRFQHKDKSLILSDMNGAIRRKRAEQPTNMPSAGSVFRRTAGEPPALLIDRAGLKGMSVGGAAVSEKHSGFIVNTKNAKSADVRLLIDKIKHIIMDKYAQPLECEVELLEE